MGCMGVFIYIRACLHDDSLYFRMSEVVHWLEEVDLEEYTNAFAELGVKKIKHMKDVERHHLKDMHMKELEIVRFLKKKTETFGIKTESL